MLKQQKLSVFSATAVLMLISAASADEKTGPAGSELVGTWKMVSAEFGGQKSTLPERLTVLKHVTPTQFIWVRIETSSGKVVASAGGPYVLKGDTYTETPEYVSPEFETIRGKTYSFKWRLEGDKWHHTSVLADGPEIVEVWERVKPE